ncbi:hypothetical protein ACIQYQ_09830 [Pseudomonas asiatica]|uniref:hypothetical protein n=1 Tax=Pseudomonas asiatica TaxID=2219225 RepID=UPI00383A48F9
MGIQYWEFEKADQTDLIFFQKISLQDGSGKKILLWGSYNPEDLKPDEFEEHELIFHTATVLSKSEIEGFQNHLATRIKGGWYHQIH